MDETLDEEAVRLDVRIALPNETYDDLSRIIATDEALLALKEAIEQVIAKKLDPYDGYKYVVTVEENFD